MHRTPPKKIEVDSKHFHLRVLLLIICLTVAAVSLGYGFIQLLSRQTGWQQVEISSKEVNCSEDFTLNYYFGDAGITASAEYRQVSALYTTACEDGYRFFYREGGLSTLSAAPNEPVTVPAPLYEALKLIGGSGGRSLFLAPVYDEYDRIFLCETEAEAALYDPARDPEIAAHIAEMAVYCNDPDMIRLEFPGENTVKLVIAEDYLSYAEENGISEFLDFGWMKNAFIADHIADTLTEAGCTAGYLASYDGFTRNLDGSGQKYSQNIFARQENLVDMPAVMEYEGPTSIVSLRDYPMGEIDRWHYFAFSDGRIASVYLDPESGTNKNAAHELLAYSSKKSCAEVLMETAPVWLNGFDEQRLTELAGEDIFAVWTAGTELRHSEEELTLNLVSGENSYTKKHISP
ncbi:MAG: hypothetical protein IKM31_09015 [Oscillospiraceae bacterium]|nr:hypothetical protein [Oscillospiraceae bacterium]